MKKATMEFTLDELVVLRKGLKAIYDNRDQVLNNVFVRITNAATLIVTKEDTDKQLMKSIKGKQNGNYKI